MTMIIFYLTIIYKLREQIKKLNTQIVTIYTQNKMISNQMLFQVGNYIGEKQTSSRLKEWNMFQIFSCHLISICF